MKRGTLCFLIILIISFTGCSSKNKLPVAQFTITPDNGRAPLLVSVDASTSSDPDGEISSYKWNFGDEETGEGKTATHNFINAGTYKITLSITDNKGGEHSTDETVTVTANTVPVANTQNLITKQNTNLDITLTASDTEGDSLTYIIEQIPENGMLTGDAPNISYKPNSDFVGTDQFTFKANDSYDDSKLATVQITVTDGLEPNNKADQASDITIGEKTRSFINPASDVDWFDFALEKDLTVKVSVKTKEIGSSLSSTFTLLDKDEKEIAKTASNENSLQADLTAGSYYVVLWDSTQGDDFKNQSHQNLEPLASSNQFYEVEISIINTVPVAESQEVITDEDKPVAIKLTASDKEDSDLVYTIKTSPAHGTLSGTAPNLTYTPDANFNGEDSFTFEASDGQIISEIATVNITVEPVNDPPSAKSQDVATKEDTSVKITVNGSDPEEDDLTYEIVDNPKNGTLDGTPPNLTYTPNKGFTDEDSFTFKANDGEKDSDPARIKIQVIPAEKSIPVVQDQNVTTEEDVFVNITLTGSDADGDPLTYQIVSDPSQGTLSGTPPNLIYTPHVDANGNDSFTFKANDGLADSSEGQVNIAITPVNDPPVANGQVLTVEENKTLDIALSATDIDSPQNSVVFSIQSQPQHGTLSGTAPNLIYTPNTDFRGQDSFTFQVSDGDQTSQTAEIVIQVTEKPNDAPVAEPQNVTTNEDKSASIVLKATDADNDPLSYAVVSQPTNGKLTGTPPNLTYTPNANFNGEDSFTFKANDGKADSGLATVKITVASVNDLPIADPQSVEVNEGDSVSITLTGSDIDGDTLTYQIAAQPKNGKLSGTPPNLAYTPDDGFSGSDSFLFRSHDGQIDSSFAQVDITIHPVTKSKAIFPKESTCSGGLVGQDCTLTVALRENTETYKGFGFKITNSPDNFILKSDITVGALPKDCFVSAVPSDNAVIGLCQSGQEFTGNGTLVTLTFERKGAGETVFTISNPKVTTASDNQTMLLSGGSLTVN